MSKETAMTSYKFNNRIFSKMRELRVYTLGSKYRILNNVSAYISNKPEDEQMNLLEVIDYINEHASYNDEDEPAVYVGSYSKYNGGDLYGYHKLSIIKICVLNILNISYTCDNYS